MSDLAKRLKELGFKEIRDAKCVMCKKPINSQVDGLFCSVACQIEAAEQIELTSPSRPGVAQYHLDTEDNDD